MADHPLRSTDHLSRADPDTEAWPASPKVLKRPDSLSLTTEMRRRTSTDQGANPIVNPIANPKADPMADPRADPIDRPYSQYCGQFYSKSCSLDQF